MKKINLIEWLSRNSHEKQKPQRFARYAAMLLMLLIFGVGQMWAGQYNHNWYGNVFFRAPDNWNLSTNSKVQVVITRSSTGASEYVCCCNMSQVGSTRLYYAWISWNHSDWKQNEYLAFIANPTTWGDNSGNGTGTFALTSCACYTTPYDYGVNENKKPYLFTPNSESNGATLSGTCYTNGSEYEDRVPSNFNVAQRINLYTNGSLSKTGGSVRIDGIYMTGSTTTGSSNVNNGSNTYASYDACVGSSVTLTATPNTGYQFDGWYTEGTGGSLVSSSNPYSYTCKGTKTLYARFSEKTYSLTFSHNGHGSIAVGGNTVSSGSTANVNHISTKALVATPSTGYNFSGWTKSGTNTDKVTIADMTATGASTTIKATSTGATVTAGFTAKTYSITLDGNEGSDGLATATYNSSTLTSFSGSSRASYDLNGYFTNTSGGTKVINADGTLVASAGSYTNSSSQWIYDDDVELHAQWTYNPVTYSVTYAVGTGYTSYGSLSAKNTSTSAAIASGSSLESGTGVTFTATPNTGYVVEGWYTNPACTSGKHDEGSNTYSTTLSGNITVYVKFVEKTWSVAFAAGTGGTVTTPAASPQTVGQVTGISIAATPATGYTFNRWTITSGSGSFTSAVTTNSNTFKPTAASTITASFNETKSTITVTTATSSQGSLKFGSTSQSWGATASLGVATTQEITATAAAGFRFVRWDLSGAAASSSTLTNTTITLKADGSGSTGTATAVFEEDLSSPWIVAGGNKIVTTGTTWRTTADDNNTMFKKTGHSTESVVYFTVPVTTVCSGDNNGNFQFKIYNTSTSTWYSLGADGDSYHLLKAEDGTAKSLVTDGKNIELRAYVTGNYEFKLDYSTSTPKLTVTWPVFNQVRISVASPTDATNTGNFDLSDPVSSVRSVKRTLNANTTYTFKIVYNSDFYGYNSGTFTRSTSTSSNLRTLSTEGGNLTLTTDYAGDYTFKFNQSDKTLSVDFPEAYKITYGKGSVNGSTGNCSAINTDNGNSSVTSNSTWVKSGHHVKLTAPDEKEGYSWDGWYDNAAGTGEKVYTTKVCTLTVSSAATLYACYTINNHAITHSDASHGSYTIKVGDASAVSTNTTSDYGKMITLAATPATGYHFGSWSVYKTGTPATTVTVTSNQFTMPDYAVTVGATFSPTTYSITYHTNGGSEIAAGSYNIETATFALPTTSTKTGYTFAGWYTNSELTGDAVISIAVGSYGNKEYWAKWTPNPYAISFDATTNGVLEGESPKNVIYDETSVAECPTAAKDGYCFDGWYTAASEGVKVIDAEGNLQPNVTVSAVQWTNGSSQWKKASATTVYAVYVAPTIEMTPDPTALNSRKTEKDTVVIHQTFSCVPTGNYNVVYTVGYSANHTQLPSQPTIKYGTGLGTGNDTIKMPMDANTYEIVAELRTGSTRGAGTIVKRDTIDYVVEAQYAVTLHYVVDGKNIRESRQVYAYPTSAPSEVRVFMEESGYELDYWEMGVGIDSVPGRGSRTDEGSLGIMEHKYINAANNGNIYLHYKPKTNTVYFFNTFDKYWYSTIMKKYDYGTTTSYWSNTYGAGSKTGPSTGILTPDTVKMTTTDLSNLHWMASIGSTTTNFAFVSEKKSQEHFWGEIEGNKYPKVIYRTDYNAATPMFVPVSKNVDEDYYILNQASDGEAHYYRGFWVKYSPNSDSTGYYLKVYNGTEYGSSLVESIPLRLTQTGEGNTWELTASMDLEANKTYGFKFTKATGTSSVDWYSSSGTMTASNHEGWVFTSEAGNNCGLTTTSAGDYTFHVFCKDFGTIAANNANANQVQGQLAVTVDYATVSGDYRVIYSDATQTEVIASPSIHPRENGQDTVSFFIRKSAESRVMKIQKYTTNWADLKAVDLSSIAKDSVYVLYLQQNGEADDIEVAGYDFYDGDYYIRTDCVDEHKWDYKQSLDNHRMSPSDYGQSSVQPFKFTHYYAHWIGEGGNVKFVVANKYAPCISDTLITDTYANAAGGALPTIADDKDDGASVRFMYNKGTNEIKRDYLAGAEGKAYSADFLKITTSGSEMGTTDATPSVITTKTFTDEKNWIYQAAIKAKPGLAAKLSAAYNGNTQYFLGSKDEEVAILGGTGDNWQQFLLTYDFKQNRLICAWQPDGSEIEGEIPINADIMIIRHGQDDAQQIIFKNNESKLSAVKYIYSVMQFNRDDMVGMMPRWDYWSYQHCMYYISFPYDVLVNDIMAPGRMGTEWRIQRYNGAKRAKGWFAGDGVTTFWEDVQAGDTLKAYEGYSLLLNRRIFNDGSSTVWQNKGAGTKLYMYFPSKDATTGVVANKTVNVTVPSHECTLDRVFDQDLGKPVSEQRNHKIVDSHWNMIGTPLFEDKVASTITDGPTMEASTGRDELQYIYEWNPAGNTLGIRNALNTGFEFKTMYSYMAQYAGTITFVGSAVNKIVAANRSADKKNYTINLELTKDDAFVGRTYVELRENAVDTFLLNEDVCMVKNGVSADVYTLAGAYEAGANVLSIDNHIVPVGVDVKAAGTYTFSMPGNFDGEIILVDNYMQTRTNLMMEDYEIALPKANISDRFYLEININNTPTAIDGVSGDGSFKDGKAHKFIMNDMMYILKDGLLFDARGNRVK